MIRNGKITYVKPPFEEIQHDVTRFVTDKDGKKHPAESSLHSDISLLQRIERLRLSSEQLVVLREQLQPLNNAAQSELDTLDTSGLSDDELINACPSRYIQTASEKMDAIKSLAKADKEYKDKLQQIADKAKKKAEEDRINKEFRDKMTAYFYGDDK